MKHSFHKMCGDVYPSKYFFCQKLLLKLMFRFIYNFTNNQHKNTCEEHLYLCFIVYQQ